MTRLFPIVALISIVFSTIATAAPANSNKALPSTDPYIVIFNTSHPNFPHVTDVLSRVGLSVDHDDVHTIFNNSVFRGFCANMESQCIDALNAMPEVAVVEPSGMLRIAATRLGSPWGLQRVSSTAKVTGDMLALNYTYTYDPVTELGLGVDIYSIDTGINTAHLAFDGRAEMIWPTATSFDDNGA
jgi:cerevisin